eukprot:jgi/Bigna1/141697/aug1.64_g16405
MMSVNLFLTTHIRFDSPWKPRGLVFDRAKKTLYISWNDCVTYIVSDSVEGNLTGVCNSTGAVDGSSPTAKFNTPTGQLEPPTTDIPGISTKRYANCMAVGRWESSSTLPLDLYIADSGNCRIRRFSALTNETETVSGGACGFADGSSTSARYQRPTDVAVDLNANDESRRVFVADADAHRIRALILSNLTVLSIAGDGTVGHRDGASAAAKIAYPVSIAFHKDTDSLFISAFTGSHGLSPDERSDGHNAQPDNGCPVGFTVQAAFGVTPNRGSVGLTDGVAFCFATNALAFVSVSNHNRALWQPRRRWQCVIVVVALSEPRYCSSDNGHACDKRTQHIVTLSQPEH